MGRRKRYEKVLKGTVFRDDAGNAAQRIAAAEQQYFNNGGGGEFVDPHTFTKPYTVNEVIVPADEATGQVALEAHVKNIIEVDGLKFKDLNGNGTLDVYEDWRQPVDARVDDLLSQMTLDEEIGLLWHASTGGTFTSMYPYTEEWLYSNEPTYTAADGSCYVPMYHSIISDNVTTYLHNVNGTPETLIYENNAFQEIAETARLGIPVVLSCDRSYNTWAGMVNMPNYAVGIAHDPGTAVQPCCTVREGRARHRLPCAVPFLWRGNRLMVRRRCELHRQDGRHRNQGV